SAGSGAAMPVWREPWRRASRARPISSRQATAAPAPAAAAPAAPAGDDIIARLQQLGELRSAGVLNDAEFEQAKARILGG
ncbi:MAG: SHOCT domain-containing protein, partial [Chloroflexota bacterium]|nr:SHOCT domain-containing protein [Chloroflexota bacterium]